MKKGMQYEKKKIIQYEYSIKKMLFQKLLPWNFFFSYPTEAQGSID